MTKSQIPIKSQVPISNVRGLRSSLGFESWDFIGIWDLVIGISLLTSPTSA
jgi:hypothetical protein